MSLPDEPPASSTYGIVLVTTASQTEAEAIAHALVHEKLAACVNLLPIQSIYVWQGEVHHDQEWQLLIKTDLTQFESIQTRIQAMHSYDVPEIIALAIEVGSLSYLRWMATQVGAD
jgi:periplasmic divalent cation tolerance protein